MHARTALIAAGLVLALTALTACKSATGQTSSTPGLKGTVTGSRTWVTGTGAKAVRHYELTIKHRGKTIKATVTETLYYACRAKGSKVPACMYPTR